MFRLGSFLKLSGYTTGELVGREMSAGLLSYQYRVSAPGLLDGVSAGVSIEARRLGDAGTGGARSSTRDGRSLFFAVDSRLRPPCLACGRGRGHNTQEPVRPSLGRPGTAFNPSPTQRRRPR